MLSTMLQLCFGFILLATAIQGKSKDLKKQLAEMALNGDLIDGIFKPMKYLSEGSFGVVYKGERIEENQKRAVALKFVKLKHRRETDKEYTIYTFLKAIDNSYCERFGIPAVYYYKQFGRGHMLMAMTFFDGGDLIDVARKGYFVLSDEKNVINSLLLFKDFVRTSKYIHCQGVRHDDLKPENIMIRKHRSYLIDYNLSTKILQKEMGGTFEYLSRRVHRNELRTALDDWESFLYTMCYLNMIDLPWLRKKAYQGTKKDQIFEKCGQWKEDTRGTINRIKRAVKWMPLQRVYVAFAEECFKKNGTFPDYDAIDDVITAQIEEVVSPPTPAFYTWLSPKIKWQANDEMIENPLPKIRNSILDPKLIDFVNFKYPDVDFNHFNGSYLNELKRAAAHIVNKVLGTVTVR